LCILRNENDPTTKLLQKMMVDYDSVKEQFKSMITSDDDYTSGPTEASFSSESDSEEAAGESFGGGTTANKSGKKSKTPVLDNFGRDLTQMAEENRLDPVVGRQKEIERVSQILSRRKKNNPLLIGEPGVGKSAIAEGLALRIIQKKGLKGTVQQKGGYFRLSLLSSRHKIPWSIRRAYESGHERIGKK